jgi:hypothetical protein
MSNPFFDHPILNSPYDCPQRHWELDADGQPTQQILETRRPAEFITPIPKPKKRKKAAQQDEMLFDEGLNLSTQAQQYDITPGAACPIPASGRSRQRRPVCCSTGGTTSSAGCAPSSAKWKRPKPRSG